MKFQMYKTIPTIDDHIPSDIPASAARELLRRATAPIRHTARVVATQAAAHEWALEHADGDDVDAAAVLVLVADLIGIGGPFGLGGAGCATERHPAFTELGKGRHHASDGDAYRAAAVEALEAILCEINEVELAYKVGIVLTPDGITIAGTHHAGWAVLPTHWWRSLAGRGLLKANGADGQHLCQIDGLEACSVTEEVSVTVKGSVKDWAELYNSAIRGRGGRGGHDE